MPTTYTHTSLLQARTSLAIRLQDPNYIFWKREELDAYIVEALRSWQALTCFYRERQPLTTSANVPYYDLTSVLPAGAFDYNITDSSTISLMLYQLIERQLLAGPIWDGTNQFSLEQIIQALQRRRDRFLGDTGVVVTKTTLPVSAPPIGRIPIPDNVIDIRRAAWINSDGLATNLWRDDEFSVNAYKAGWQQNPADPPEVYCVTVTPPCSIQVAPGPLNDGLLEICAVQSGAPLDATGILLGVPDDLAWGVKWGALADLLMGDGPGLDPQRAAYCESRYQEAVQLATLMPSLLLAQVNDESIESGSIFDVDAFNSDWRANLDRPNFAAMVGRNLLALANCPDDIYGVTLDLVVNMPVPINGADKVQIGRDMLDTLLDEAQHIAAWKMGGQEFQLTTALHQNFIQAAGKQNSRIRQAAFYNDAIRQPGIKQLSEVTVLTVPRSAQYESSK